MSEISIKQVCCTCLETNRNLYQMCRIRDSINLLYTLLTHDPNAYKEGFYKDTASLRVCWECAAIIRRIKRFQLQACAVQKYLTAIADGQNVKLKPFSYLAITNNHKPNFIFQHSSHDEENFIDCGENSEIKTEYDSDVPLSNFLCKNNDDWNNSENDEIGNDNIQIGNENETSCNNNCGKIDNRHEKSDDYGKSDYDYEYDNDNGKSDNDYGKSNNHYGKSENGKYDNIGINGNNGNLDQTKHKPVTTQKSEFLKKKKVKLKSIKQKYNKYFHVTILSEEEMQNRRKDYKFKQPWKCELCGIEFKTENEMNDHNLEAHEKKNDSQCVICLSYTEDIQTHKQTHYHSYDCVLCMYKVNTYKQIVKHLKSCHKEVCKGKKESKRKINRNDIPKYPCAECDATFQKKDHRWKHVQKAHREGFKCSTCDKRFAFKSNLERHEKIHTGVFPRQSCPVCLKMVRSDLFAAHSRTHAQRRSHFCVVCDKTFVSRATYETHLKLSMAHATDDVCRHKCTECHKSYRSRGELQDHVNYFHKGIALHKCPICGKGLATKRCIRRHVRRTHEGIKENAKDKICQQCGRAFRDKKSLCEHERVHTGARPLACAQCARTFRQRAALYTHMRRIHK